MGHWELVICTAAGAAIPVVMKSLFVSIFKDFTLRFSWTIFWIRIFDGTFGRITKDVIWSGSWKITWFVSSNTFLKANDWNGTIYRCFDTIAAEGMGHTQAGTSIPYGFIGKLSRDKTILTGTWFDRRGAKAGYHGAFQVRVTNAGHLVEGKWLGFSDKSPIIKTGKLLWEKLP